MKEAFTLNIANELSLKKWQVENTLKLLEEEATVPFIARYRKEATGELDETGIAAIKEKHSKLVDLDQRKKTILKEIKKQGKLTGELKKQIDEAGTMTGLEDIYLPYKPRKKTRGTTAREKGLEELAKILFKQKEDKIDALASRFLNEKVGDIKEALQGARDIIAEWINEDKKARDAIREIFGKQARIRSAVIKGREGDGMKYRDYFNFAEELDRCPSHRLLALRRGEKEKYLRVSIVIEEENAIEALEKIFIKNSSEASNQVSAAIRDSFKRLLAPSIETEFARESKEAADREAITVFAENLRQLLMAPILGQKKVLALDPGYRTGCKLVCLDRQGDLEHNDTVYPHPPQKEAEKSRKKLVELCDKSGIQAIAIGNGTAGRETKEFVDSIEFDRDIKVFMVNESGASIYSASKIAREEFPGYDATVRGAVSIGRRLMDPLAELVKIDPKNLGVGQYQHDVDQEKLRLSLAGVVESCVNMVGVNLNTASRHLLTYVSGLRPAVALNIVNYRTKNGPFKSRQQLLDIPRMGDKAYEQCAGFLRIQDGSQPLDNSAVHPESYRVVEQMAGDLNSNIGELMAREELREKIDPRDYISDSAGLPTLKDILSELAKPGRDPRKKITVFEFRKGIKTLEDLAEGMVLPGIITNITNFGAFVDIGIKTDGLVHISQLSHDYIKNPTDVVHLHQEVKVKVIDIDLPRGRVQLSLKDAE